MIAKLESYVEGDIRDLHIDLGEMDPEDPPALQDMCVFAAATECDAILFRMYRCLKAKRVERPDYGQIVDEVLTGPEITFRINTISSSWKRFIKD